METAKGRGARSNASGRYEPEQHQSFDDGWTQDDAEAAPLRTTLTPEHARTIIARNDSPDIGFDRSINPYKGCEHGCIYCYARPSHAWMGLSPGLDFESRLFFKPEAARLLEQELAKPRYVPRRIHIGGNTDPYQPVERDLKSTLFMLVSAFAGVETMRAAYDHAVADGYRFYSYGDGSLLFRSN